ncbi:hypothetical protein ACOMHN_004890 [Nucella lapillus]
MGVIDKLLIDSPCSQQQGFQQRPGGFGGQESRPTFFGRAVRETRGRDRGNRTGRPWATGGLAIPLHQLWATGCPAYTDGPARYRSYSGATGQAGSGRQEARSPLTDQQL